MRASNADRRRRGVWRRHAVVARVAAADTDRRLPAAKERAVGVRSAVPSPGDAGLPLAGPRRRSAADEVAPRRRAHGRAPARAVARTTSAAHPRGARSVGVARAAFDAVRRTRRGGFALRASPIAAGVAAVLGATGGVGPVADAVTAREVRAVTARAVAASMIAPTRPRPRAPRGAGADPDLVVDARHRREVGARARTHERDERDARAHGVGRSLASQARSSVIASASPNAAPANIATT